jgi:hypothetical protein
MVDNTQAIPMVDKNNNPSSLNYSEETLVVIAHISPLGPLIVGEINEPLCPCQGQSFRALTLERAASIRCGATFSYGSRVSTAF